MLSSNAPQKPSSVRWLSCLLAAFLLLVAGPSLLQAQDSGDGNVTQDLAGSALNISGLCDYEKYLDKVESAEETIGMIEELTGWSPTNSFSLPVTDYVSLLPDILGTEATKDAAEAETKGLLYEIEEVCNSGVQADEIERIKEIVEAGREGIGELVEEVLEDEDLLEVELEDGEPRLTGDFAELFRETTPKAGGVQDSASKMTLDAVEGTMTASDSLREAITAYEEDIADLKHELFELAKPDTLEDEQWMCPENYPDPDDEGVDLRTDPRSGRPICGFATPERSVQVMAQLELLIAEMKGHTNSITTRKLELGATGLATDNYYRKRKQAASIKSLTKN